MVWHLYPWLESSELVNGRAGCESGSGRQISQRIVVTASVFARGASLKATDCSPPSSTSSPS